MINTLPKSLIDSATVMMNEALAAPAHKAMATRAANSSKDSTGLTAAERISKDVMPIGQDRVVIPLQRTFTPSKAVTTHLENNGFAVHDYEQGLAVKHDSPDRKLRIGRVLNQTNAPEHVKKAFEKDPARQGIKSDPAFVVISRKPSDVAAMSTHQNWTSCQTLGGKAKVTEKGVTFEQHQEKGSYSEMVPGIVSSGAHIAYLVKHPDDIDTHNGPIARTTLNPFTSPDHTIIRPSEEYGDHWEGFHHTVNKWAEENFPAKRPSYTRHRDVYQEGKQSIENYGSEHDEFWKNNPSYDAARNTTSQPVIEHYANRLMGKTDTPLGRQFLGHVMSNPHVSDAVGDRLVHHFINSSFRDVHPVLAKSAKTPKQIQTVMDKTMGDTFIGSVLAKNPNTTHNQLHDILDMYGAGETNIPGVRKIPHNGYSPDVIQGVANHKNANDSHFEKILSLDSLQTHGAPMKDGSIQDHWGSLESIARRYHSEDIGRKVVGAWTHQLGMVPHSIVYDVAEKHPHLLHGVSDKDIGEAIHKHPMSSSLMKIGLERNTPTTLKSVAFATKDHDLLSKLSQHPNVDVAEHAKRAKSSLERMEKYNAEEKAFNQGNGL